MPNIRIGFACCLGLFSSTVSAYGAEALRTETIQHECQIHIWQRGIYVSESHAQLGAFGLLGAALQSDYDRKYPPTSVQGAMEDALNTNALPDTLRDLQWQNYTGRKNSIVVFERDAVSDEKFKQIKSSQSPIIQNDGDCSIELYIDEQKFSGGALKSHLFSDFYARTFYNGVYAAKFAGLWKQTRHISVQDADSAYAAKQIFKAAFVDNLNRFLTLKLPKPKF